jgi:hypothetical protein
MKKAVAKALPPFQYDGLEVSEMKVAILVVGLPDTA